MMPQQIETVINLLKANEINDWNTKRFTKKWPNSDTRKKEGLPESGGKFQKKTPPITTTDGASTLTPKKGIAFIIS